jgi:glycerate 2-kinase
MIRRTKNISTMRNDIVEIFFSGLKAVEPGAAIKKYCRVDGEEFIIGEQSYDLKNYSNIFIVGAGKGTAPMASAVEEILGEKISGGIINVKYGHVTELERIKMNEGAHPVPDLNGQHGADAILDLVKKAGRNDLVIMLISGGGSALLPLPVQGLTLEDKQDTIRELLACGASIGEINTIRKHTSRIKGGQLAQAAFPAVLVSLILSDVVGDSLDVISSGPTVPDSSTYLDCMKIIEKYEIKNSLPKRVVRHIEDGLSGKILETPKRGDKVFEKTYNLVVGSNMEAVIASMEKAENLKYNTIVLSSMIEGETRDVARVHSAIAREVLKTGYPVSPPACILSGGETTVTIRGKGKGGRNQEFVLASVQYIDGEDNIVVLSGGTDGNDGPTDAAGAIADNKTLEKSKALGIDHESFLLNNDSYNFFKQLEDLFITGPTNTNVMDLRIILVS